MKSLSHQKHQFEQVQHPGLIRHTFSEIFPETVTDTAAIGYMLSRLSRTDAPILWVQDRLSYRETGRPYLAGMNTTRPIIMVNLSRAVDVLWSLEDGLRCRALAAVIGEIWGDPGALDFTATKRLALRSEAADVPCWLIRHAATPNLSAARNRWRIGSVPSAPAPYDAQAPGKPRWSLDLFRSRQAKPGHWTVTYDKTTGRLNYDASIRDGTVAAGDRAARQRATG
jgi:protein ImuA